MTVNYLQYIEKFRPGGDLAARFLVSGTDPRVRQVVGENIVASAWSRGLPLFLVDNTQTGADLSAGLGRYRVLNALGGEVSLCSDILEVSTLKGISRLRALLADLGFDGTRAMKVVAYLNFARETERRLGNPGPLTVEVLEQYGGTMLVQWKISQLAESGVLDEANCQYLLGRYAEVSAAAADFENFLVLIAPFVGNTRPARDTAIHLPIGEFGTDEPMQRMLCKLLLSYIRQESRAVVLILDSGRGERHWLLDLLANLPADAEVHLLSQDIFSFEDADLGLIMGRFPVRVYTRHESMASCEKVERQCGEVNVVKHAFTVAVDRRFRANSAWDILMGTNRTETEITNAPTREPLYRKEYIQMLPSGTAIIDCGGSKTPFAF